MTPGSSAPPAVPAVRSRRQGSFRLPLPPATAFDLFTAEGERRWVPEWDPVILGEGRCDEVGTVFLTSHAGEETIWTVIEADRDAGRLLYSRVSPGRRAGTVRVELAADDNASRVTVSYDLASLGPDGVPAVLAMDEAGFAAMLEEWQRMINEALAQGN